MRSGSRTPARGSRGRCRAFTLIEMLVVMAVIATLLTMALPRYFSGLQRSREAVLHQNLAVLRDNLDKYFGDKGRYPASLEELVTANYLRGIPPDPVTQSNVTWISVPPAEREMGGVADVRSGAAGLASDGTEYRSW